MVYFMENPIKMDDLGVPFIFGNTRIGTWFDFTFASIYPPEV